MALLDVATTLSTPQMLISWDVNGILEFRSLRSTDWVIYEPSNREEFVMLAKALRLASKAMNEAAMGWDE